MNNYMDDTLYFVKYIYVLKEYFSKSVMCGKGGNCLPARATHTLFCHSSLSSSIAPKATQGYMQQLDYSTKIIFHERNDFILFIFNVMHGGYKFINVFMNIICNQKFMFCKDLKDHGIGFDINNKLLY